MRLATRVQGDRADVDPRALARLVVASDVEHHLVAVDVRVVVRHRDRQRVVVHLAWQEVADHEVVALEDLVHRRRLVDLAGDGHVVVDVEGVRVQTAVPADHVQRMGRTGHPGADDAGAGAVLDQDLDVLALDEQRTDRPVQVALAVRRVLEQLPVAREVALGRRDVAVGLDRVEPAGLRRQPAVGGGTGQQHVVTAPVGERPEDRLHGPTARLDVDALVTDRVAVERRGLGPGDHVGDADVVVGQDEPTAGDRVRAGRPLEEPVQPEVSRLERVVGDPRLVGELPHVGADDRRGHPAVIEQRGVGREALLPHQLLVVQPAFGVAELGVPLGRDLADLPVVRHLRSPR